MAKVTIILEDSTNEDGDTVLRITPDFGGEFDPDSVAQEYAEVILDMIINNAQNSEELKERLQSGAAEDSSKH